MKCAYCGKGMKKNIRTKDHIIPRGLFPENVPPSVQLITCKCCLECQSDKQSCEDYIITSIRLDEKSAEYLGGNELNESAIRALRRLDKGLIQKINRSLTWKWQSHYGILQYLPAGIRPLKEEMEKFLKYLTKGMYFHMTRALVPCGMRVKTFIPLIPQSIPYPFSAFDANLVNLVTQCIDYSDCAKSVGDGTFMCFMKTLLDEDSEKSVSVFVFAIRGRVSITLLVPDESQLLRT